MFCERKEKSTKATNLIKGTFWKIRRIQIQKYPQTSIEPKYGAFYLNDKVRVHGLVLLVQLS